LKKKKNILPFLALEKRAVTPTNIFKFISNLGYRLIAIKV
jgi:hypothetical protein